MRRTLLFVILLAVGLLFLSYSPPISRGSAVALTVVRSDSVYLPGNSVPVQITVRTIAFREDGSRAELLHLSDARTSEGPLLRKKLIDIAAKRWVVVDPVGKSVTTYPLTDAAASFYRSVPTATCDTSQAITRETMLGFDVAVVEKTRRHPRNPEERIVRSWIAAELNCFPLREEISIRLNGSEVQKTVRSVVSVVLGQPADWIFAVPADYTERAPSAAVQQALSQDPTRTGDTMPQAGLTLLDDVYERHRQKK